MIVLFFIHTVLWCPLDVNTTVLYPDTNLYKCFTGLYNCFVVLKHCRTWLWEQSVVIYTHKRWRAFTKHSYTTNNTRWPLKDMFTEAQGECWIHGFSSSSLGLRKRDISVKTDKKCAYLESFPGWLWGRMLWNGSLRLNSLDWVHYTKTGLGLGCNFIGKHVKRSWTPRPVLASMSTHESSIRCHNVGRVCYY